MKNKLIIAGLAVLSVIACNKEENRPEEVSVPAEITVGVKTISTKTALDETKEKAVKSLQIFVFRGDVLDATKYGENVSELTLSCTSGSRTIYALTNAAELGGITTKSQLLAATSSLSDNQLGKMQMIGSTSATLPSAATINVPVSRIASRILLKGIKRAFTSPSLASQTMTIDAVYLTNAAGDINYGLTSAPSVWYNKMSYESANCIADFMYHPLSSAIANNASLTQTIALYTYPNPSTAETEGGTWSARKTRLVVKATLGSSTYYYPITLPVLQNNHSYEISNLTITRPGSDSQDTPVSFADATFSISVTDWTSEAVSDTPGSDTGITI